MFDKEAKSWVKKHTKIDYQASYGELPIEPSATKSYKAGAKFAYNKANEWHFPSKGEYPKEDTAEEETLYLLWFGLDDSDYITGLFSRGRFWCFDSGWFEASEVVAWKEIVRAERPKGSK